MKDNRTELQKVKSEIELKENELEKYEKKLVQLKNQEKKIRKRASLEERKKRNHRLIERGAILESFMALPTFDLFTMAFQLSYYEKLPTNFQITNGKKLYPRACRAVRFRIISSF